MKAWPEHPPGGGGGGGVVESAVSESRGGGLTVDGSVVLPLFCSKCDDSRESVLSRMSVCDSSCGQER